MDKTASFCSSCGGQAIKYDFNVSTSNTQHTLHQEFPGKFYLHISGMLLCVFGASLAMAGFVVMDFAELLSEIGVFGQGPAHIRLYTAIVILYAVWRTFMGIYGIKHSSNPYTSGLLRNLAIVDIAVSFAISLTVAISGGGFMWILVTFYPVTLCYLIGAVKNRIMPPMLYDYSTATDIPRCGNCGEETVDEDGDFCQYCGTNLQPVIAPFLPTSKLSRTESKLDAKMNFRMDTKIEPKTESKFEPKSKFESKSEPRLESKFEPKFESKFESKAESKTPRGYKASALSTFSESAWTCACCGEQNFTTRRKCGTCGRIGRW